MLKETLSVLAPIVAIIAILLPILISVRRSVRKVESQQVPQNPDEPVKKLMLSYEDVTRGIDMIYDKVVCEKSFPDVLLCVGRGGAITGGLIAKKIHRLTGRSIPIFIINKYEHDFTVGCSKTDLEGKKILLVDDASRSGTSILKAKERLNQMFEKNVEFKTVALLVVEAYHEPNPKQEVDFWAFFTESQLIRLPWDRRQFSD